MDNDSQNISLNTVKENYLKFIVGGVFALAAAMVVLFVISNFANLFPPSLVATTPKSDETGVSPFADVEMVFDRNVSVGNESKFKIEPAVDGQTVISGKGLKFVPSMHLAFGKKFTVTLTDPIGSWGVKGKTVSFSFTVKDRSSLSDDEKSKLQAESSLGLGKESQKAAQTDPVIKRAYAVNSLIQSLPYDTDSFSISYIASTSIFLIYIKQNPYDTNKQAALDYIKGYGVDDTSAINIQYTSAKGVAPGLK
jgi:hypothetical protein